MKISDFISMFFIDNNINTIFTVTGGFAMHLNDSFGLSSTINNKKFNIFYQHHEQACGYSAVGFTKTNNQPCIVCTSAGCAASNTISPCLVAYQDSLPIIFISGQVKINETITTINNNKKIKLRHYAGADSDIISMVKDITKYAVEISNVNEIYDVLKNVLFNLKNGRLGPIWISIPVDIQAMDIEYKLINNDFDKILLNINELKLLEKMLFSSSRPLILVGNGIKIANCKQKFNDFIKKYKIPVVVSILGTELIETENELYSGKVGLLGNRHGNFTLQNCDLLICLGCRLAQGIIGYRSEWFARDAKIVMIDIDQNELNKHNYDLKINMDLNIFFDNFNINYSENIDWLTKCIHWKNKWINEMPSNLSNTNGINPYLTLDIFYKMAPNNKITICSSGSIVTNIWHKIIIKENDIFINSSQGDMGFELPASIGACIAEKNKLILCMLGEGSFQLNIQELQTIIQYKLPIKILLFNNNAYGAIQITQTNFFKNKYGVDTESGLSFPNTEKIANAYNIKYINIHKNDEIENKLKEFIEYKEAIICEVFSCVQARYPKLSAIKNNDGTFTNRPMEDMEPFMDREELYKEMITKII